MALALLQGPAWTPVCPLCPCWGRILGQVLLLVWEREGRSW